MRRVTFSQKVKEELVNLEMEDNEQASLWLCSALAASGLFRAGEVYIKSAQRAFIEKLQLEVRRLWDIEANVGEKTAYAYLTISGQAQVQIVRQEMLAHLHYNTFRGTLERQAGSFAPALRLTALRSIFLAAGSLAEPASSYQIEFALRRLSVANFVEELLELEDIEILRLQHGAYHMLYIKNGDQIAQLLANGGAHMSYLQFEQIRVRKNMNGMVNRTVNCDSANSQRVADTSARQIELLRDLDAANGVDKLPDDLRVVARLRLDNPGFSIREMGECMDPPLGKSGMYHRLGKLEVWAKNYLAELGEDSGT